MRVAFIGLGVMGFPMAGHLAAAGHEVRVYNRSPEKARRWAEAHEGVAGATVAETTDGCQRVILCVGDDNDVRGVVAEALDTMAIGGVIVDHTTTSARLAREMDAIARQAGRWFVDAPVSGGQAGAQTGKLTVMAGGDAIAVSRIRELVSPYTKALTYIGEAGSGQLAKMANQICIAGVVQGLAEAVHFTRRAGVDAGLVFEAISKGAAQSWQLDNRWTTMVEGSFDFGFAVDWMRKDLGLVLDEASRIGATLDTTALIDRYYEEVQAAGGGRWDTSSLVTRLDRGGNRS
jgi:3-hydroxyisobutyrate dehydrogenase